MGRARETWNANVIVTISGTPGSGKSTVARELARGLSFGHKSAGDFMREMAAARGISVLALSAIAEQDGGTIDRAIDARTRRFGGTEDGFVIDARLAWYFIPDSVKVFLDVSLEVAAERIFGDRRRAESENTDLGTTRGAIEHRLASETMRYMDYYGIEWLDPEHFDLVIDTSFLAAGQVVDEIVAYLDSLVSPRP